MENISALCDLFLNGEAGDQQMGRALGPRVGREVGRFGSISIPRFPQPPINLEGLVS